MRESDMSALQGWYRRDCMGRTNLVRRIAGLSLVSAFCMSLIGFSSNSAKAQSAQYSANRSGIRSRAEQEAEQKVALSPDKIIELLRQEPGLLLQVKKMLVRKAYEQGRILDPEDLTDEAVFQLLTEDHNICVLATREIEDRAYVRAKPTQQEIEQQRQLDAANGVIRTPTPGAPQLDKTASQENAYWQRHEAETERPLEGAPQNPNPPAPTTPRAIPQLDNSARQSNVAGLQQTQEPFDGMGLDSGALDSGMMTRITPDQLATLLSASSSSGTPPLSLLGGGSSLQGRAATSQFPNFGGLGANPGSGMTLDGLGQKSGVDSFSRAGDINPLQASLDMPRRNRPSIQDMNLDRPQIRRRTNPYANIPSLYDLYAQVSQRPAMLERFGASVFRDGTGNTDRLPMDLPAGPDYVLGPGDGVSIDIWGGVAQRLRRVVDSSGRLALPEVGTVEVAGRTLGDVQRLVQAALRTQFHEVEADVSLSRIRSVRVYVVGEVENPGPYDISSLSTPLNALYAAGGPTSRGSLRHLRLYRGKDMVQEVDAYDLLLHGVHSDLARIQSGDTIQVPPMGAEVTVAGMVMHPAIYELGNEKSLAEALELAGGVLTSGTFRHIEVERVVAHESHTMLQIDMPESNDAQAVNKTLDDFKVQDGDKVRISPILPYSDKTVYLDGHVFHPGKYAYREGMKLTDLIHSYSDLLPEPYGQHAEVIRLQSPDYTPVVLAFNLGDAMEGKEPDLVLKPFDTVRVFGRYDFE